jgi:hypothetical protein
MRIPRLLCEWPDRLRARVAETANSLVVGPARATAQVTAMAMALILGAALAGPAAARRPLPDKRVVHAPAHAPAPAHALDMTVTADGVERPDPLRLLPDEGCDEPQGSLISPQAALPDTSDHPAIAEAQVATPDRPELA